MTNTKNPHEPAYFTETGYSSLIVDATVQAKYSLDLIMDAERDGIAKSFFYQLMDAYPQGAPQGDAGNGMFNYSETPKPVATAFHNLTTLIKDPGPNAATFKAKPLNYEVQGLAKSGGTLAVEQSSGRYFIIIWAEPEIWDPKTGTEIPAPAAIADLTLPERFASVRVFDPLVAVTPIATYANQRNLKITITDHPMLVEVDRTAGPGAKTGPS